MSLIGSILVKFGMQTAEYLQGSQQVRAEAAKTNAAIAASARDGAAKTKSAYAQALENINEQFGRSSTFAKTIHTLGGAGELLGIGIAAREIDHLAEQSENVYKAYLKGDDALRDQVGQLLREVPIAGQLGDAMARVYEMISGTARYAAEMKQQTDAVEAVAAAMAIRLEQVKASAQSSADFTSRMRSQVELISAELNKDQWKIKLLAIDERDKANFQAIIDAASKFKLDPKVDKVRQQIAELTKQLTSIPRNIDIIDKDAASNARLWNNGGIPTKSVPNPQYDVVADQIERAKKNLAAMEASIDSDAQRDAFEAEKRSMADRISAALITGNQWLTAQLKPVQEWVKRHDELVKQAAEDAKEADKARAEFAKQTADEVGKSIKEWGDNYLDRFKKWSTEVARLAADARTPMQKYQDELKNIESHTGFLGLNADQANALKGRAFGELQNVLKAPAPDIMERRSAFGVGSVDSGNSMAEFARQTANNTQKLPDLFDDLKDAISKIPGVSAIMHIGAAAT